jgi:hypothetical protein
MSVLIGIGLAGWSLIAAVVAVVLGRMIRGRDQQVPRPDVAARIPAPRPQPVAESTDGSPLSERGRTQGV